MSDDILDDKQSELDLYPQILKNKYQRIKILGTGAYGCVIQYEIIDKSNKQKKGALENKDKKYVAVKFENTVKVRVQTILGEALITKKLNDMNFTNVPKYIEHGFIQVGSEPYNYLIIESLDFQLMNYIKTKIENLTNEEINNYMQNTTVKLIESLQKFHSSGYVHLDIKPDNIFIRKQNYYDIEKQQEDEFCFIDFGTSSEYMISEGKHKVLKQTGAIKGTTIFASQNSLKMYELSRRDDLESLFLTMIYVVNKLVNNVEGFPYEKNNEEDNQNLNLLQAKQKNEMSLKFIEQVDGYLFDYDHTNWVILQLIECIRIVRELNFEEQPDYTKFIKIIQYKEPVKIDQQDDILNYLIENHQNLIENFPNHDSNSSLQIINQLNEEKNQGYQSDKSLLEKDLEDKNNNPKNESSSSNLNIDVNGTNQYDRNIIHQNNKCNSKRQEKIDMGMLLNILRKTLTSKYRKNTLNKKKQD
eukprot:403367877